MRVPRVASAVLHVSPCFQLWVQEGAAQAALAESCPRPVSKSLLHVGGVVVWRQDPPRTRVQMMKPLVGDVRVAHVFDSRGCFGRRPTATASWIIAWMRGSAVGAAMSRALLCTDSGLACAERGLYLAVFRETWEQRPQRSLSHLVMNFSGSLDRVVHPENVVDTTDGKFCLRVLTCLKLVHDRGQLLWPDHFTGDIVYGVGFAKQPDIPLQ